MLHDNQKKWFAARTRRNQERLIKTRLEEVGIDHFIPFHHEFHQRKDRKVRLLVPVIPNIVFIHTDYQTSLSIINNERIHISYLKAIDRKGPLIVPQKQLEDFKLICESKIDCNLVENLVKGDRVVVLDGCLAGLEGELINNNKNNHRIIVRLDGIASFEIVITKCKLKKIDKHPPLHSHSRKTLCKI